MGGCIGAATRLYRALLILYPAPFRREYGPLMLAAFEKMCEEAAEEGGFRALARLWWHVLFDLTISVLVQHLEEKGRWMMSRRVWLLWILASIAGWLAAAWFLLPTVPSLAIPAGGALVSALHVLILQRTVARTGWWRAALPLNAGSWLLPLLLFALVPWQQLSGPLFFGALLSMLLLSAAMVGLLQGIALRPLLGSPWRWAVVPAIALLASAAAGLALFNTLLPLAANLTARGAFSFALPGEFISPVTVRQMEALFPLLHLLIAVIAAGIYGVVTGATIMRLGDPNPARGAIALR
jgi:hypothetical protein